jgi:L-ascorbate metabolism protein UlaG (beta-lactamase superfamily)
MKITWLGHSAYRLEFGKNVVLFDPFISGNPTTPWPLDKVAEGVTHILLTHGHDDHVGDTADIAKKTGAQVISNYEVCMFLNGQGAENINPGNTGGTVSAGDFTVTFTQALHSSGTTKDGQSIYLGNPNGLILKTGDGRSIYHMGDTDIFGDMALINELYKPEIGIVPIGDRFTMGGETAAVAVKRFFNFKSVIPAHYATFGLLDQTAEKFVNALKGHTTAVNVLTPGTTTEI